jgi:hypothetical protein
MMWDEAPKRPHLNPLPEGDYVFSAALRFSTFPISLTPRFSDVHDRVYYHNLFSGLLVADKKPLKRFGTPSGVIKTPS